MSRKKPYYHPNMTAKQALPEKYAEILNETIEELRVGRGVGHASDLHHHLWNEDFFITGKEDAKKWLGCEAFDCIGLVQEYEHDNFGEVSTDLSSPEKVANMVAYILGEEVLQESGILREKWDVALEEEDLEAIADELAEELAA